MPRQSRTDRLLAEKEQKLEAEVARAVAEAERLGGELRLLRDLRKQLTTLPKRASRAKRVVAASTQTNTNTTATAA